MSFILRRTFWAFVVSVICFNGRAFCAPDAAPVKIGVILPLSGALAQFGTAAKNGILLAQEENTPLLSKLEFSFEDCRDDAKAAIAAFQKLTQVDGVGLVYLWGAMPVHAVAPIAEAAKVPLIALSTEADAMKNRNYVVRFCSLAEPYAMALLGYIRNKGYRNIAVIKTELAFYNSVMQALQENLRADESLQVVDSVLPSELDFRSSISKLKSKRFDILGVLLNTGQISQFYLQAAALRYSIPTFGTNSMESDAELKAARGTMAGAVYPTQGAKKDFLARYRARFGNDLQYPFAANAYDFAMLAARISGSGAVPPAGAEIISAFKTLGPQAGESGRFSFVESPETGKGFDFEVVLKRVEIDGFAPLSVVE